MPPHHCCAPATHAVPWFYARVVRVLILPFVRVCTFYVALYAGSDVPHTFMRILVYTLRCAVITQQQFWWCGVVDLPSPAGTRLQFTVVPFFRTLRFRTFSPFAVCVRFRHGLWDRLNVVFRDIFSQTSTPHRTPHAHTTHHTHTCTLFTHAATHSARTALWLLYLLPYFSNILSRTFRVPCARCAYHDVRANVTAASIPSPTSIDAPCTAATPR